MRSEREPITLDHPGRRATDHKLEALANSALLRVVQFLIVGIAAPMIGWALSTVISRLDQIDAALQASRVNSATMELRMLSIEKHRNESENKDSKQSERLLKVEFEIEQIKRAIGGGK